MNQIDKKIILSVGILVLSGIFIFLSASLIYLKNPENFAKLFFLQLVAIFLGFISIYIIQKNKNINYKTIKNNAIYFFIFALILQLAVLLPVVGIERQGATRWLDIGFMTIQPSEIFRLASILFIANIFFILGDKLKDFKFFLKIVWAPVLLISTFYFLTKDLGSLMILMISIFGMIIFTKVNKKILLPLAFGGIFLVILIAWFFVPHAKKRMEVFIHPEKADIQNEYYQQNNMLEAIGSGKVFGVGYGESLQKFNGIIPETTSDSIFSVFAEEWGFAGSLVLIFLYIFLTYAIFFKVKNIKNLYQKYVVVGLGINLVFPAFYNIAAVVGIMPLSGFPLTFISKGGTSILISLISVGIILLFVKNK